jgi:AraC-like DNA-binding protein
MAIGRRIGNARELTSPARPLTRTASGRTIVSMRDATSSVRLLRAIVMALEFEGVDASSLLAEIAIERAELGDNDGRIPFLKLEDAWEIAGRLSSDVAFGLHLAERASIGAFDVLDYAAKSCANLEEAFHRLVRFQRLLHDVIAVKLEPHGDEVWVVHRVAVEPMSVPRHASEAAVAAWILRARALTQVDVRPRRIRFQHGRPSDVSEHQRIFGCPIEFDSPVNVVVLAASDLALPITTADSGLSAVLDRHAELILSKLPERGFLAEVRAALTESMRAGAPDLASVAKKLATSTRSLQRRLADEGTRFEELLDELRRELAARYLQSPELTVAEVAFLLGYSDPSAFNRAFRRWAGCTPKAFRLKPHGANPR